jgi:hypothetical protein
LYGIAEVADAFAELVQLGFDADQEVDGYNDRKTIIPYRVQDIFH